MFGDDSERYIEGFEALLEDQSIEDLLEQEDLTPAEALYKLFLEGHVRSPFDR
jgi:hypothetical protein